MPGPVVFAAKVTMLPEAEALTTDAVSPLMSEARAAAMEAVVVPEPLQLIVSEWPLTVIVLVPES